MLISVRAEQVEDREAVRAVNIAAFGREDEANLVDRLRGLASVLSFVALESDRIVGHLLFSPVSIEGCTETVLGLAPLAVLPEHQRRGIGTQLVQAGLEACRRVGGHAIVVLGDPEYYARFGFSPANRKGLRCEYDVPEEAFMLLELEPGVLEHCAGTVQYLPQFEGL